QVLEPELEAGDARPAEDDAVQVPAEHAEAVEELDVLDREARLREARPELRPLVAPVVVDGGVDRPVEAAVRGDEEDQPPAWRQALSEAAEGGPVVLDVLEDVQAQDGVEPVGGEGGGVEVGQIEGHDLDPGMPLERVGEDPEVTRVQVGGDHVLATEEMAGHVADPRADL